MNGRVAILLLAFVAAVAVVKADGVNGKAVFIFSFVAVMIGISWFFSSRRAKAPSAFEIAVANTWLIFRRIVCSVGALFFVFAAVMIGFSLFQRAAEQSLMGRLGAAFSMLAIAAFCVWVGIFGQGERRSDWRDDVELHRENKRRYHWRR